MTASGPADAGPTGASGGFGGDAEPGAPARESGLLGRVRERLGARAEVWRSPDFVRVWAAHTVSQTGSQVTTVAVPLIAVSQLGAGPTAMGVLAAAGRVPFLLYLVAGVGVDRVRKRRMMVLLDVARGALMLVIPLLTVLGLLNLWLLGALLAVVVGLSVWFDTAFMSYLPGLIGRRRLMQANTITESSTSAATTVGPGLGGLLVQLLTASGAVILDALSFFASAFFLVRIGRPEQVAPAGARPGLRTVVAEIGQGVAFVARHPVLRALNLAVAVNNAVLAAELALYVLYLVRDLSLPPWLIGLTLAAGGPGALAGSAVAGRVQRRFGVGAAIIGGLAVFGLFGFLIPLAPSGNEPVAVALLVVAAFVMSAGGQVCVVNVLTTRQLTTPEHLLGRVNASFRFAALGLSSVGAVLGGLLGSAVGLRTALFVAVAGMLLAPLIVALSPVRRMRDLPDHAEAA